jgi:hypothetical protein
LILCFGRTLLMWLKVVWTSGRNATEVWSSRIQWQALKFAVFCYLRVALTSLTLSPLVTLRTTRFNHNQ